MFFSSSSLFAIRVVSSAYLRLLIFLPTILIAACALSSLAFLMMYSACKLNKHSDNIHCMFNFMKITSIFHILVIVIGAEFFYHAFNLLNDD